MVVIIRASSNADQVAAQLGLYARKVDENWPKVLDHTALLLETQIKANASLPAGGPPGPRAITGHYRSTWNSRKTSHTERTVGTNAPQGRRLEYGFSGRDALGRLYDQPPYPHVRPAVEAIGPVFREAMKGVLKP